MPPSDVRQDRAARDTVRLRLLATSDLHMHIHPHDYVANRAGAPLGLARTAGLIARMRARAANSLLFDNGDFLQGSALGDHAATNWRPGDPDLGPHPIIAAMNSLGYDAIGLGNHDFNYGLDFLRAVIADARFPVVASNALPRDGRPLAPRWLRIDRDVQDEAGRTHRLRIGIVSFVPAQTALWDRHILGDTLQTPDILASAAEVLPHLRAEGVDIVIALAHTGIGPGFAGSEDEGAALALAATGEIDAIIAGHSHLVFPLPSAPSLDGTGINVARGRLHGVPTVMPGAMGSHLGVIDLTLYPLAGGGWQVGPSRARVMPVAIRGRDGRLRTRSLPVPEIMKVTARDHLATMAHMNRPIGTLLKPLTTHFARVADTAVMRLTAAALADHAAKSARGTPLQDLPVLAAVAPFRAGGRSGPEHFTNLPDGLLRERHLLDLYTFDNEFRAVTIGREGLLDWLERSVAAFRTIRPGCADQPLIDPAFPSYNFDMIPGLTYAVDLSQPPRFDNEGRLISPRSQRIVDLAWQGRPLGPDDRFLLATNSYRLAARAVFETSPDASLALSDATACRDVLREAMARGLPNDNSPPRWHLRLPEGATVLFETALEADARGLQGTGLTGTPLGRTTQGYQLFRLQRSDATD